MKTCKRFLYGALSILTIILICGCAAKTQEGDVMKRYIHYLETTDPAKGAGLQPGTTVEEQSIRRFDEFYQVFSADIIRKGVRDLYADGAYFQDPFKAVEGIDAIEAYFLKSTEGVQSCTFDIQEFAVHEGNYYFRWVMHLTLKRYPDEPIQALGMSHVRFDKEGKVVFHQDYWDTGVIYERVPLMGSIIRWFKKQF